MDGARMRTNGARMRTDGARTSMSVRCPSALSVRIPSASVRCPSSFFADGQRTDAHSCGWNVAPPVRAVLLHASETWPVTVEDQW